MKDKKTGRGISDVQRQGSEVESTLGAIVKEAETLYEKWKVANGPSSSHSHYEILDPIKLHGLLGLRALFCMLRGGKAAWVFGVINEIIEQEGLPKITIPEDELGRLSYISRRYLGWADKHLSPSVTELHYSAMFAEDQANLFWWHVVAPDVGCNYGGTYFSGSLQQAQDYGKKAQELRDRIKVMLESQADQWKDSE